MEFDGWNYCYENLPYWEVRNRFPYVYDQLNNVERLEWEEGEY